MGRGHAARPHRQSSLEAGSPGSGKSLGASRQAEEPKAQVEAQQAGACEIRGGRVMRTVATPIPLQDLLQCLPGAGGH